MIDKNNKNTVVELFAGVGGFRVGLNNVQLKNNQVIEEDNWKIVFANQWEPSTTIQSAFDCYEQRFGKSPCHSNEDIAKVDAKEIPDHKLLVGGFPCQDYSVARSKKGEKGIEGKKGVLWWEIHRIVEAKKPKFILLENVDRLLKAPSSQRGRDFGIMLYSLSKLGYNIEWRVINAAEVGFAQKRRRVFIFAFHTNTKYSKNLSKHTSSDIILKSGLFAKNFPVTKHSKKEIDLIKSLADFDDVVAVSDHFGFNFQNSGVCINKQIHTLRTDILNPHFITLGDILISDERTEDFTISDETFLKFSKLRGGKKIKRINPKGEEYFYSEGSMSEYDAPNKPGRTMLTSEGSINRSTHIIKKEEGTFRFLHPIEAERLNCFPDDWTNTGMTTKKRYFMMGNALVTGIVKILGNTLKDLE